LIALAKAKPGQLNYASDSTGSPNHLAAELFKAMAGVDIVRIPYKGGGPALNDLLGGQVQIMFPVAAAVLPHVKSGKLRALAVTSAQATELTPGLPTAAASGLPGYESVSIQGIFAPTGTSSTLINRLNRDIVRVVNGANLKEKFFSVGIESVGSSPEEFAATVKSEMSRLGKVIKDAGIRDE
jgi:tripartite-type tricarboxylate transporter receptor subunit TctC